MKRHVKIYFDYFGYNQSDWIKCEMPECGRKAVDINHIEPRGMGGNPKGDKDKIENLMALCRECHIKYEGVEKEYQKEIHLKNLSLRNVNQQN